MSERGKMCQISVSLSVHEKEQIKIQNTENSSTTRGQQEKHAM